MLLVLSLMLFHKICLDAQSLYVRCGVVGGDPNMLRSYHARWAASPYMYKFQSTAENDRNSSKSKGEIYAFTPS